MNCPYCGAVLKESDNFCTACGMRVRRQQAAPDGRTPARTAGEQQSPRSRRTTAEPEAAETVARERSREQAAQERRARELEREEALAAARKARVEELSPDPRARVEVPKPPKDVPQKGWSSGFAAALCLVACLLSVLAGLMLLFTPIFELPLLGASAATSSELVHAVLSSVDPGVSVFLSGLLDVGGLTALDLVGVGADLSDALGSPNVAVGFGLALGLAFVAAALALAGALSSVVLRRPTPALILSGLVLCLCGTGATAGSVLADDRIVGGLRNSLSSAFAELGVQLPAAAQVVAPTVWLVAVAACGLAAFVLALWARSRQNADRLGV